MVSRALELAIGKAAALPEQAQEEIGREMLERIDQLGQLRADVSIGIDQLDARQGRTFDIEALIEQLRAEHANR